MRSDASGEMEEILRARLRRAKGRRQEIRETLRELGGVLSAAMPRRPRRTPAWRFGATRRSVLARSASMFGAVGAARRRLRRRPAYPLLAALTLGLGIAVSTAMFSVVDAVLLRPLPFPDPEQIVSVYATNPAYRDHPTLSALADRGRLSVPELQAFVDDPVPELAAIGGYSVDNRVVYPDGAGAYRIWLGFGTPALLSDVLKVRPVVGRHFTEPEARSEEQVVVLSEEYWKRAFSGDPGVVGRRLRSSAGALEIVGVVPQLSEVLGLEVDAWVPLRMRSGIDDHFLPVLARLAAGATAGEASVSMKRVLDDLVPAGHVDHEVRLLPHQADQTRGVRSALLLLWAGAGLLLLVACASATAIMVAEGIGRRREFAIRRALGAGRGQILSQLFGEGMVVSAVAATVGIALAGVATRLLLFVAPADVPRISEAGLDVRALIFGIGIGLAVGALTSLPPGLRQFRRTALPILGRGGGGTSRLEGALVTGELALAIVLLAGAGLLGRTVLALDAVDTGMAHESLLAVRVDPPGELLQRAPSQGDGAPGTGDPRDAFYRTLAAELRGLPGARAAALARVVPFHPYRENNDVEPEGAAGTTLRAERRVVSGNFLEVAGIHLVEGRPLAAADELPGAPGRAVVSAGLAARAWPGESAIGKHLRYYDGELTVVGVAGNVRDETVEEETEIAFYVPGGWAHEVMPWILVRADTLPELLVPEVREHIRGLGPDVVIIELGPVKDYFRTEIADRVYRARLMAVFSTMALLLALAGVFGVSARHVGSRVHEIGVRKALGARDAQVVTSVVGRALGLAVAAAVLGLSAVVILARLIEAFLWGVEPRDPVILLGTLALTLATVTLAALVPARRTLSVDPARALRAE